MPSQIGSASFRTAEAATRIRCKRFKSLACFLVKICPPDGIEALIKMLLDEGMVKPVTRNTGAFNLVQAQSIHQVMLHAKHFA